ncbi:MAG: hypothetical protein AAF467_06205 [Actinomycetota bacterium]
MRFALASLSLLLAVLLVMVASFAVEQRHDQLVGEAGIALSRVESEIERVVPPPPPAPDCVVVRFASPRFDTNSSAVSPDEWAAVTVTAAAVLLAPCVIDPIGERCAPMRVVVDVDGHADERIRVAEGGNLTLSVDRAAAVVVALDAAGLRTGRITGWGSVRPAQGPVPDTRSPEQRWSADRRVDLTLRCP